MAEDESYEDRARKREELAQRQAARGAARDEGKPGFSETATNIGAELIKSYGFKRDSDTGDWDWSIGNIGEAFKESPVWTTLDYLTLGVMPARWGVAAARVARGVTTPGAAYKAGTVGFREAAAMAVETAPRTWVGRKLSNPLTHRVSPKYQKLLDEQGGGDAFERMGLYEMGKVEMGLEKSAIEVTRNDLVGGFGKASKEDRALSARFLEIGMDPTDVRATSALGVKGTEAYTKTWDFRNALHESAFELGLIDEVTYVKNLKTYNPRIYKEFLDATVDTPGAFKGTGKGGLERFKHRADQPVEGLNQIWDVNASINEMAKAANVVAKQRWAQKVGNSVLAKDGHELVPWLAALGGQSAKLNGIGDDVIEQAKLLLAQAQNGNPVGQEALDELLHAGGWRRMRDLFPGKELPGYLSRLPKELLEKYLDPVAAKDIVGTLKFADKADHWMTNLYRGSLNMFRVSKTAWNPATHVRNHVGNVLFHHMATGGVPKLNPLKGLKSFVKQDADYLEAVKAGVVGSSFDVEIREAIEAIYGKGGAGGAGTPIDFLGKGKVAKLLQKGSAKAQKFYSDIDSVWKLDAFITQRAKYTKAGLTREDAVAKAMLDVHKYMPAFLEHSPFANAIRGHVPFASFAAESVRIWKNAMAEKPHIAFFWEHMADGMTQTFAAMSGMGQRDLDELHSRLPKYIQQKKMVMLPFNVDGQPHFLDLSYVIPMGNLGSEADDQRGLLFDGIINPSSNPFFSVATAYMTGKDPFSGRDIKPRFTERQLGIDVKGEKTRATVGLVEHMFTTLMPPIIPPGYVGTNLLELARSQKDPTMGMDLEGNAVRTIAANVFGARMYEASVKSQLNNVRTETNDMQTRRGEAWDRWEFASANGDVAGMDSAQRDIESITDNFKENGRSYFADNIKRHVPGSLYGLPTKQLEEGIRRARQLGKFSKDDMKMLGLMHARLRERQGSSSTRKRRKSSRGKRRSSR